MKKNNKENQLKFYATTVEEELRFSEKIEIDVEQIPLPPLFYTYEEGYAYINQERQNMLQRREKDLEKHKKLKEEVKEKYLKDYKQFLSEYKPPHIPNPERFTPSQLNTMQQLTKQISNVSIPEIVIDIVGVRETNCTVEEKIKHLSSRGVPFSDEDAVSLLSIMLDSKMGSALATEICVDILIPYIGKGRVKETTWRDYLIDGQLKTIFEILPGRISRQLGVPHIPLSMTRIPNSSIPFPTTEDDLETILDETKNDEKRPVWGEKNK